MKCEPSDHVNSIIMNPNCPRCQKGYLVVRKSGEDREFLGCSNYPYCDYTVNNLEIMDNQIRCSSCGGYMVKRSGPYSEFYGCANYPFCNNKLNIEATSKTNGDSFKANESYYDFRSEKTVDTNLEIILKK